MLATLQTHYRNRVQRRLITHRMEAYRELCAVTVEAKLLSRRATNQVNPNPNPDPNTNTNTNPNPNPNPNTNTNR